MASLVVAVQDSHHHSFAAADVYKHSPSTCPASHEFPGEPDVVVLTSGGLRIPVHSNVLASASSVLENIIIDRPEKHRRKSSDKVISISGVPCEAVAAFIRFLYLFRCREEEMEKYGIHLLALSHVYVIPKLKQACSKGLCEQLTMENVVDVLQLARMCDAPDLYLKCMKLVNRNFKAVEMTEGWKFLQDHDPYLELHILQFMDETEQRERKSKRYREEQRVYMELSEAMECLEHIFTEGCTIVKPHHIMIIDKRSSAPATCCTNSITCHGLQQLITHFAACKFKRSQQNLNGSREEGQGEGYCLRCKRMWQLLRLHSSICDRSCMVPLCRQLKMKTQQQEEKCWKKEEKRWRLLVRKVVSAKVMSSLSSSHTIRIMSKRSD